MSEHATGQVTSSAADYYETYFVPALFSARTAPLLELAGLCPGQALLDVGCGTGVLARAAWQRLQREGSVTGVDINEGMLETARKVAGDIEWRMGRAEQLPFEDASFDRVVSQFAIMFFEDKSAAVREMWRVLRPGGVLTVAVWDSLSNTPGYAAMTALHRRLFGEQVGRELETPYSLGDKQKLAALFAHGGVPDVDIVTHSDTVVFPSMAAWVDMDVKGWTLGEMIGPDGYDRLVEAAERELQDFVQSDGRVVFPSPSHMIIARKS